MRNRGRLVASVVVAMSVVAVAAGTVVRAAHEEVIRGLGQRQVESAGRLLRAMEHAEIETLNATLARLTIDPRLAAAFGQRDRAALAALVQPRVRDLEAENGVTQLTFILPDRTVFFRAHRPELFGDPAVRPVLDKAIRTGQVAAGKDLGRTGFAIRVALPWIHDGRLIGYLEAGETTRRFLARMRRETGDEYLLLVGQRHLHQGEQAAAGSTDPRAWETVGGAVLIDATTEDRPKALAGLGDARELPAEGALVEVTARRGRSHALGAVPVANATGERVGALVVLHETTAVRAALRRAQARVIIVLAVATLAFAALVAFFPGPRSGGAEREYGGAPPSPPAG